MSSQEYILDRSRVRERGDQALLQSAPEAAKRRQQALDHIATCMKEGAQLAQAHLFLESARAFQTPLFDYARHLVRLGEESAKPDGERLIEYSGSQRHDVERFLLQPKSMVKELEIVKLAESLDLWVSYADKDAELAAVVLAGKTPQERARALVEGTHLDQREVRKALMNGGQKAVAESQDAMIALARLVDARSRQVRQQLSETIVEPCRQAYAELSRIREQAMRGESYPDGTGTLRLSFGKVQPYDDWRTGLLLADVFQYAKENQLPTKWETVKLRLDPEALLTTIVFKCSADGMPGSSGSPIVDRQGRLLGVVAWGCDAAAQLAYLEGQSGCFAVAAHGILEVLDKIYHADELVKELGGNKQVPRRVSLPPPPAFGPTVPTTGLPPPASFPATAHSDPSLSNGIPPVTPVGAPGLAERDYPPTMPSTLPSAGKTSSQWSVNPFPPPDALLPPETEPPPTIAATKATSLVKLHKELTPALVKALTDSDAEVRQSAKTALTNVGAEALPAIIEAVQEKRRPAGPLLRSKL
jgi:hypothetical protein